MPGSGRGSEVTHRPQLRDPLAESSGGAGDEAMDGPTPQLRIGERHDEAEDPVGAGVRRCSLQIGARGLEPVVPVGEHDGADTDECARRRDALGVVDAPDLVEHAVRVDGAGERRHRSAASSVTPSARVSPQIGSKLARVARRSESRSLLALGSVRSCGRMSPSPPRREGQRPDHADCAVTWRRPVASAHAIRYP